ncbi:hypothetical protein M0805_000099 [Coniferiporia weirii]|nr:hypothetical protein M0805_000099 [Coniferiporia weirii]
MASDGEEDYLSDKFLLQEAAASSTSAKPSTYAERRKQAQRQAELKNAQNRKKSRRQLEEEAREEGLRRSLFERAQAEERELGLQNKAMSMMLKMGFKPGETLGRSGGEQSAPAPAAGPSSGPPILAPSPSHPEPDLGVPSTKGPDLQHRVVPLAVDVWSGKKGVGLGKRAASPGAAERLAKAARVGEEAAKETYRSRTRADYEERRAAGRLLGATRTLIALDEKAGVQFNALSLDPQDTTTFPAELLELLSGGDGDGGPGTRTLLGDRETESERLRQQMQLDALHPLDDPALGGESGVGIGIGIGPEQPKPPRRDASLPLSLSEETVEDAKAFLQLGAQDRLERVIRYLREKYYYCFWCVTQYNDREDLDGNCPGVDEDAHD